MSLFAEPCHQDGVGMPRSHFDTSAVAPELRFAAWREAIAVLFDVSYDGRVDAATFPASVEAYLLGNNITLATWCGARQSFARPLSKIARDGHDCYLIQFYFEGNCIARRTDARHSAQPRDMVIIDAAQPLAFETTEFRNASLIVPRHLLAPMLRDPDDHNMRIVPASVPLVTLLCDHIEALLRHASRFSFDDAREAAKATLGLVAAAINMATDQMPTLDARQAPLAEIRKFIEGNLSDSTLCAELLADQFGLSRAKLYRLFQPLGGVAHYISERQLRRAMLEIADPRNRYRPISDIAADLGWASQSDFGRAFRRRFGIAPREIRSSAKIISIATDRADPARAWAAWIKNTH